MKKNIIGLLFCSFHFFANGQQQKTFNDTASLYPVEVASIRAGDKSPFTKTEISKKEIQKLNTGQDLPFVLNQTASVVVNSDAGTGIGYTGIRIRGTDATRINITLNGIPFNDAESQGSFLVDIPDFISSVNSIQVQRGVGTSSNGTGAFGASISISTNELNLKPYAEINNNAGSFNTWKNTIKVGTGAINDHFTFDARLSRIVSDGYIDRATSNLSAFYLSGVYFNARSSIRFNVFSGKEKTYQAWNGVPESFLNTHRTFNSSGTEKTGDPYNNETDNYNQTHYQLFLDHSLNEKWKFNTAFYLVKGKGYYENYKAQQPYADYGLPNIILGDTTIESTDLIRQKWLDNDFYGQIFSIRYHNKKHSVTLGGNWSVYDGKHFGNITWAQFGIENDHQYYTNDAKKQETGIYLKWEYQLSENWNLFADMQYRYVNHVMNGFDNSPDLYTSRQFNFLNPKAGISYSKHGWKGYLSYASANKEPNRDDFETGQFTQPKKETLHDVEAGIEKRKQHYYFAATVYYMYYKDQLVLTGLLNDVGAYTRTNVPISYRTGIELQAGFSFAKWINANANISLSKNQVRSFNEYLDNYDANGTWLGQELIKHNNTNIAYSPGIIGSAVVNILPIPNLELSLISKYVNKQYLDNTQDEARKLNGFYTQDLRIIYNIKCKLIKTLNITGQVNNLFNNKYEPNGAVYAGIYDGNKYADKYYFPMAGINWVIGLNLGF